MTKKANLPPQWSFPSPSTSPKTHTQFFIPVSNQNIRRIITGSFLGLTAVWLLGSRPVLPTPSKATPMPICGSYRE